MAQQTKIAPLGRRFLVADLYYKNLRRQLQRQKRRAFYRQLREDQLLDRAYRGFTKEQKQQDQQLKTQLEWLNKQLK
jgi:hypothetical protein